MMENLLKKNLKKRRGWAKQTGTEAYRLYDWQIPEYPFFIDVYGKHFVVYDRTEEKDKERKAEMLNEINEALMKIFDVPSDQIVWKMRERQKGTGQYEKLARKNEKEVIREGERKYYVNLYDYLDTGLFLDHRPLRNQFQKSSQGEFLNLFSYTCAVGVAAALGGAKTTNVDISNTYLNWGKDNYRLNRLTLRNHQFIREDVLKWLEESREKFDVIFLDPPSFSNSKRMESKSFDVLRDQENLVTTCRKRLKRNGTLYFSNNHSKFRLAESLQSLNPKDITKDTIPFDFHNQKTHRCFKFIR